MPAKISYHFDNFRLDLTMQQLFLNDINVPLSSRAFDLLLVFVQNPGRDLNREDLVHYVWKGVSVGEGNFDVTLHKVRTALGEPMRAPRYILKTSGGYRFVADVRNVTDEEKDAKGAVLKMPVAADQKGKSARFVRSNHSIHIIVASSLYAALYAAAIPLEVAYQFDQFGATALIIAPLVFAAILITSVSALILNRKLAFRDKASGFVVSILVFVISAALLLGALTFFLPNYPITDSHLQTYPAQAAYLKDETYFLVLAIFFLIIPFHFIVTMERELENGNYRSVVGLLTGNKLIPAPDGAPYLRVSALASLLVIFFIMSIAMTARLLDNLKPSPYQNLFVQLVYLRALLFFGLGSECLIWYYRALEDLKSQNDRLLV